MASLELCDLLLPIVSKKPQFWKWILVAAHNAVQGGMVCALSGTSGTGALEKNSAAEMLDWIQDRAPNKRPIPKEKLDSFDKLLKRACRTGPMEYLDGRALALAEQQKKDLRKLHTEFRNNLLHFTPKGWSIEAAGLPRITRAAVDATEQLMAHPGVTLHLSSAARARLQSAIRSIRARLSGS